MAQNPDIHLADNLLRFNPKWWWDPIPPFFYEYLTAELARELTKIQLSKHMRMLEIEQIAAKDTLNALEQMR